MAAVAKIIFHKGDDKSDIRYIDMTKKSYSLVELRNIIIQNYQIPQETEFKITWVDKYGDNITIQSQADLDIAKTQMTFGEVYRVSYSPKPSVTFGEQPEVIPSLRIVCDVCEKQITGYRYKCLECSDYDLCSTCEGAGNHSDHICLRLPNCDIPMTRADRRVLYSAARELKKTAYSATRRAHKFGKEFLKHCARDTNEPKCEKNASQSYSGFATTTECPFSGEINVEDMAKLGTLAKEHLYPVLQACPEGTNFISDVIRNTLEAVFGAPSTSNAPNQKASQEGQASAGAPESTTSNKNSSENNNNENSQNNQSKEAEKAKPNTEQTDMDWTVISRNQVPPAPPTTTPVFSPSVSVTGDNPPSAPPSQRSIPPTSTPPDPGFVLHPDPVIARGLSQLYEMGFSNENDILTCLLGKYNGNVAEVVKTIVNMK